MADHARKQLRLRAAAILTGLPTTATRVYPGRVRPLGANPGASLFIYSTDETSEVGTMGNPPKLDRVLTLVVEGRTQVGGHADPEDDLDAIAIEVETAMAASPLGGMAVEVTLLSTALQIEASGESLIGSIKLQYRVHYRTAENAPDKAL